MAFTRPAPDAMAGATAIGRDLTTHLVSALGHPIPPATPAPDLTPAQAWARSGAMALTGDPAGPPLAPPAVAPAVMEAAGRVLSVLSASAPAPDAAALLGERARLLSLTRGGRTSCGGATRLVRAADAWVAVALARSIDWAALPGWLGPGASTWGDVVSCLRQRPAADACALADVLEIPAAAVPAAPTVVAAAPWGIRSVASAAHPRPTRPLVADLSALWAGPLCGDLLRRAGARVVKAEDPRRPDGGRLGAPAFFDAVNAGKEPLAVDLRGPGLASLLAAADVVITSARPRAFEQLGVEVDEVLAASPTVWVSVTAYGWSGPERNRVGFGDDVAAGAGLVAVHPDDGEPRFAGDAVADPLCGTLAATAALAALAAGGSWFIDASLVGAARYAVAAGGGATVAARRGQDGRWAVEGPGGPEPVAPPRARRRR